MKTLNGTDFRHYVSFATEAAARAFIRQWDHSNSPIDLTCVELAPVDDYWLGIYESPQRLADAEQRQLDAAAGIIVSNWNVV